MWPHALFHLGDWPVTAYGLCHALAALVFAALFLFAPTHRHLRPSERVTFLCLILAGAWLGNWLLVALDGHHVLAAGQSSLGALAGALTAALAAAAFRSHPPRTPTAIPNPAHHRFGERRSMFGARRRPPSPHPESASPSPSPLRHLDALAPALLAGDAIARLGCLFAGCCHGRPAWNVPWAIAYPEGGACAFPGLPLHPLPIYLSLASLTLAVALFVLRRRSPAAGVITALFLAGYGALRLPLESCRSLPVADPPGLTTNQTACVILMVAGLALLAFHLRVRASAATPSSATNLHPTTPTPGPDPRPA